MDARLRTWLPYALVIVPALILAWLGFGAVESAETATERRLAADVALEADAVRAAVAAERGVLVARLDGLAGQAAIAIHRDAPRRGMADAVHAVEGDIARALDLPDVRIRVFAADGRRLHPRLHVPDDVEESAEPAASSLMAHLGGEADRALYASGIDAAVSVWAEAKNRFHDPLHRATAQVEILRLKLREPLAAATVDGLVVALAEDAPGVALVGRRVVLAWVRAAELGSGTAAAHLRALGHQLGAVELTDTERRHVRRFLPATSFDDARPAWPEPSRDMPPPNTLDFFRAHTAKGAIPGVLAVELDTSVYQLIERVGSTVAAGRPRVTRRGGERPLEEGPVTMRGARRADSLRSDDGLEQIVRVPFLGATRTNGGASAHWFPSFLISHEEAAVFREGRVKRRFLFSLGVLGLFLLVLQGVRLTRRAVARERDAIALRDEFIQNVTHEVRTPLTSVLMHAEMLAEDAAPPDRRQAYARVVEAEGARLAALIDDLLDFAALERGHRVLEPEPMDLGAAMERAAEPFRVLAERDDVELAVEVPDAVVAAFADPHAVSRILANLIGNAWKYGRPSRDGAPGRLRLVVRGGDTSVTAEVCDDGPGIPVAEREQVFDRFGRGRDSGNKSGTGLGLALSRDLARQQGGTLDVVEDGGETVFRLRLKAMGGEAP